MLDTGQVHAILSFLRLPALLVFPFQPFTVEEVAQLQFTHGGGVTSARWVYMYVALLLVLVVVPRVLLAAVAYAREQMLARKVPLDLGDKYFQRLISLLSSAHVHLGLLTHRDEDGAAVAHVLSQEPDGGRTLIRSGNDDVLRLLIFRGCKRPRRRRTQRAGLGAFSAGYRATGPSPRPLTRTWRSRVKTATSCSMSAARPATGTPPSLCCNGWASRCWCREPAWSGRSG